ncbi:ThiF family adenylyltransferase [Aromatoleum diolicum]|uniref:ThiF family adenylyltransferase n=1 Tax=Aromatoleum diolicum TaxID=75796 RepID=A0ABX1QHX9_9RHOO|nr:ThiF family adenylyltransferase [Aromatoleum diolicum]NMG77655.1 ThiF family adenylyltransferase [Aromatoleum diolicum]
MLKTLASRNPDLQRLLEKGYALAVYSNHLVVRDIPYLDSAGQLQWSAFVGKLVFEDQTSVRPEDHQIYFAAPRPFGLDGQVVRGLGGGEAQLNMSERCRDVIVRQRFSHKLKEGGQPRPYVDHFEKIESYVAMVCGPAMARFGVNPYTFRDCEEETSNSVFKLRDTMTSRAEISDLARLFENDVIAIIGLGGSGGYVLDFMVKTPVREIRGFDPDSFFVHNAFRSPGRLDVEEGAELRQSKAEVYRKRYENFRHGLTIKPLFIDEMSAAELDGVTFAFVSVDKGSSRKRIIDLLIAKNIPFIDVGMGLKRHGGPISGTVRTTYFPHDSGHTVRSKGYVPETDPPDDVYKSNIQIAELNALNAALAVLRYKQIRGFYAGPPPLNQLLLTLDNLSLLVPDDD